MMGDRGKRRVSPVEVFTVIAMVLVGLAVLFPVYVGEHNPPNAVCTSNLKQLMFGQLIYAEDNAGRLPLAARWMDAGTPYIRNEQNLHCPAFRKTDPKAYGYAMDFALSGLQTKTAPDLATTVVLFESMLLARNATSGFYGFPDPPRHNGGNKSACLDGHVKRLNPQTEKSGP